MNFGGNKTCSCYSYLRGWAVSCFSSVLIIIGTAGSAIALPAGDYVNSAHGQNISRTALATMTPAYATGNCAHCHEQHASIDGSEPAPVGSAPDLYLGFDDEENLCFGCHGNGGIGTANAVNSKIETQYGYTVSHGTITTSGVHDSEELTAAEFSDGHAECTDCHNPHIATAINYATTAAALAEGPLIGATGVDPGARAAGVIQASGSYSGPTEITDSNHQFQVCYKCHSGWSSSAGATMDVDEQFNTANDSFHWVENDENANSDTNSHREIADGSRNGGINADATFNLAYARVMMPRYSAGTNQNFRRAKLRCSDCHGAIGADGNTVGGEPEGIHGNNGPNAYIRNNFLKIPSGSPFNTWNATVNSKTSEAVNGIWCFNCHNPSFDNSESTANTGFWGDGKNLHYLHSFEKDGGWPCQSCHLANPHGQTLNSTGSMPGNEVDVQLQHLLKPSTFRNCVDWEQSGNYGQHDTSGCAGGANYVRLGCT